MKTIKIRDDYERIYAYGYGNKSYCGADVEIEMQNYIDNTHQGQYEVDQAEYWAEDDCWSAKLTEILE